MDENKHAKIDPNLDDIETLQQLPGVGPKLAQLIIESRPYETIEDLHKVSGIGLAAIERWNDLLNLPKSREPISDGKTAGAAQNLTEEPVAVIDESQVQAKELDLTPPETQMLVDESVPRFTENQIQAEEPVPMVVESQPRLAETVPMPVESHPFEPAEPAQAAAIEPDLQAEEEPESLPDIPAQPNQNPEVYERIPPPVLPSGWISRNQAIWGMVITGFISLILAVALCLGILAGINGGLLQFASPSQVAALSTRVKGLETRMDVVEQDAQGLRGRLDNLEGLGSRLSTVENSASDLQNQLKTVQSQVKTTDENITGLQTQVDAVSKLGDQFNKFLESLQSLLNNMLPINGGVK